MSWRTLAAAGIGVTALVSSVQAHHSYAMFDASKTNVITGVVKEFRWTNPHVELLLTVIDPAGKETDYSLEGSSPSELTRKGWKRSSLNPGDAASATVHPLRSGVPGGQLMSVKVNGMTLDTNGGRGP